MFFQAIYLYADLINVTIMFECHVCFSILLGNQINADQYSTFHVLAPEASPATHLIIHKL